MRIIEKPENRESGGAPEHLNQVDDDPLVLSSYPMRQTENIQVPNKPEDKQPQENKENKQRVKKEPRENSTVSKKAPNYRKKSTGEIKLPKAPKHVKSYSLEFSVDCIKLAPNKVVDG